jgi:hypothetical protein
MEVDMKKLICIGLAAMVMLLAESSPGDAFRGGHGGHFGHGGHGRVGVFIGGPVWDPWWWGPSYYPYYPSYSSPPVVVQQQPETYIQQPTPAEEPSYWYFCKDPEGYYPYVKKCPKGWMKVAPSPAPEEEEE